MKANLRVVSFVCFLCLVACGFGQKMHVKIGFAEKGTGPILKLRGTVYAQSRAGTEHFRTAQLDESGLASFELEQGEWSFVLDGEGDVYGAKVIDAINETTAPGGIIKGPILHVKTRESLLFVYDADTGEEITNFWQPLPESPNFELKITGALWSFKFDLNADRPSYSGVILGKGYEPADIKVNVDPKPGPSSTVQIVKLHRLKPGLGKKRRVILGFSETMGGPVAKIQGRVDVWGPGTGPIQSAPLNAVGEVSFDLAPGQYVISLDGQGDIIGGNYITVTGSTPENAKFTGVYSRTKERMCMVGFYDSETGNPVYDFTSGVPTIPEFKKQDIFWYFTYDSTVANPLYSGTVTAEGYEPCSFSISIDPGTNPSFTARYFPMRKIGSAVPNSDPVSVSEGPGPHYNVKIGFSETEGGPISKFNGIVTGWRGDVPFKPVSAALNDGYANFKLQKGNWVFFLDGEKQEASIVFLKVTGDADHTGQFIRESKLVTTVLFVDETNGHLVRTEKGDLPTSVPSGVHYEPNASGFNVTIDPGSGVKTVSSDFNLPGYKPVHVSVTRPTGPGINVVTVPVTPKPDSILFRVNVVDAQGKPVERAITTLLGPKGTGSGTTVALTGLDGNSTIVAPRDGTYTLIANSATSGISVSEVTIKGGGTANVKLDTSETTMITVLHVDDKTGQLLPGAAVSVPVSQGVSKSVSNGMLVLKVRKGAGLSKFNIFTQLAGYESQRTTIGVLTPNKVCYNVVIVRMVKKR